MIYRTAFTVLLAIFSSAQLTIAQTAKADFNGTWELDAKASEGIIAA